MLTIKLLRARAFRGIGAELKLPIDGKSLVLYGDSGTGKSSTIEVIEHALTGKVGRFDESGQQVSFARHGSHVKMSPNQTVAELVVSIGQSEYKVSKSQSDRSAADIDAYLLAARSGTFILRRSKLLGFIENTPSDRYEALRPFLDLRAYEPLEGSLKRSSESYARKLSEDTARTNMAETRLRNALGLPEGTDLQESVVLDHLSAQLENIDQEHVVSKDEVVSRVSTIDTLLKDTGVTSAYHKLHDCRTRMADFVTAMPKSVGIEALAKCESQLRALENELSGAFYEQVLALGSKWIMEDEREDCPLCEQTLPDVEATLKKIQIRTDANAAVIKLRDQIRKGIPGLRSTVASVVELGGKALDKWVDAGFLEADWPFASQLSALQRVADGIGPGDRIDSPLDVAEASSHLTSGKIESARTKAEEKIEQKEKGLPDTTNTEALLQTKLKCEAFASSFESVQRDKQDIARASVVLGKLERLHHIAVDARKKASDKVFKSISAEVNRIYEKFHPDEPLGAISLDVRGHGEGGVLLKGRYAERADEDPRGFYSEAHLDTLGLAIFLALRKREAGLNREFGLIVLDDVLTSVDAPHRRRVASFLLSEFSEDYQLVITTHNRQWFEWLIQIQRSVGVAHRFINRRILSWSLEAGPELVQLEEDYDFVTKNKDDMGTEFVVPIAGRLLEHGLQALRFSLELAVPARLDERYTIGDIWPNLSSTIEKKFKPLWNELEAKCQMLNSTIVIRNWETHSNEWAKELSRDEGLEFINAVLDLFDRVYCHDCASFVTKSRAPRDGVSCKKGCLSYQPEVPAGDSEAIPTTQSNEVQQESSNA